METALNNGAERSGSAEGDGSSMARDAHRRILLAFSRCYLQGSFQMRERVAAPLRDHHPTNSPRAKGGKWGKPRLICRPGKLAQPNAVLPLCFAGD
jgi:hypothetical protein